MRRANVIFKQKKQCKYNVIWRRIRVTTVAIEKQIILYILSVCMCIYMCVCVCVSVWCVYVCDGECVRMCV